MKNIFFLFFVLFCASFAFTQRTVAPYLPEQQALAAETDALITVQFPQENMDLPAGAKNTFIFGQVTLPDVHTFLINGQVIPLGKNGTFLAFLPVESGNFTFSLTALNDTQTVTAERHVRVLGKDIRTFEDKAAFDETQLFPQDEAEFIAGDTISLFARGTPHATVEVSLPSFKNGKNIPMTEDKTNAGMYRALFTLSPDQKGKTSKVTYKMTDGPHKTKAKATSSAKITVRKETEAVQYKKITQSGTKLRHRPTAQGNLLPHHRAYGIVATDGKVNKQYRIRLHENETAWLEEDKLEPAQKPVANFIKGLSTQAQENQTRLTVETTREVPFTIEEFKNRLELTLYYVDGVEESFSMDNTSPLLELVSISQPAPQTFHLVLTFKPNARLWGYTYNFENGELVVSLNHTPTLHTTAKKPLKDVRIVIDAGHNPKRTIPYDGAVGASGYLEYEGTLALAQELKTALEKKGATVILTRKGNNRLSLVERFKYAFDQKADLFISLHYNALPETANPLAKPRGFSIYYAYPHSFDLALALHKAYTKNVPLADNGMLFNDVLFVPRISDFPSVLVENAYLMFGDQEEMARTKEGRAHFVKALQEGIIEFIKQVQQGK